MSRRLREEAGKLTPILMLTARDTIEDKIADITLVLRAKDWLKIPPVTVKEIDVTLPPAARKLYQKLKKKFGGSVLPHELHRGVDVGMGSGPLLLWILPRLRMMEWPSLTAPMTASPSKTAPVSSHTKARSASPSKATPACALRRRTSLDIASG